MRNILALVVVLMLHAEGAMSAVVGQESARRKAESVGLCREMSLVAMASGEAPAYYVFNASALDGGFVIVSGDDRVGDVLGYSDRGCFSPDDLPPALIDWLSEWEEQILEIREGRLALPSRVARAPHPSIAPMLTTKWGQQSPYSRMTPEYREYCHSATGCLAVAMAQLLKYWASDTPTDSIPAYVTDTRKLEVEALPPTTFNYAIMEDYYDDRSPLDEGLFEVAKLMRYCGQAAKMDYDINSGAVTSGEYLVKYFGFATGYTDKYHVTHMTNWEDLLYAELEAGRPMLYSGKKINGSGHVFVVDGYEDDYFHINWGWNGNYNGFFKVTAANRDNPSGGSFTDGYRYAQMAVIGLRPANATAVTMPRHDNSSAQQLVYDLQGHRVNAPAGKGIYIIGGKKVAVK